MSDSRRAPRPTDPLPSFDPVAAARRRLAELELETPPERVVFEWPEPEAAR